MQLGVYKHYKGKFYLVLGVGRHTETEEKFVVYVPLYTREGPRISLRPYDMFLGDVEVNSKKLPRFSYVGEELSPEELEK